MQDRESIKYEQLGNGLHDHNGLSWLCGYMLTQSQVTPTLCAEEKDILRALAQRVARLAELPIQQARKQQWIAHHSLKVTRPLVFIDPELAWYELLPHTVLRCQNNLARLWEYRLRKEIYWQEVIGDDRVCTKDFPVCHIHAVTGRGIETRRTGGELGGAYHIQPVLNDWDDFGKLKYREIIVDFEKTAKLLELAHDVFDGILHVVINNSWWYSDGLTDEALALRGYDQFLYDVYDYPDELHALMAFLRDEQLHILDFLEREHLLSCNNQGEFVGTGGYGWCDALPASDFTPDEVRLRDLWGYGESQSSVSVSPEMFDAFILDYQAPILNRFGLNFYGCCEVLEKRLPHVRKKIRHLRKISVSPWSDPRLMAEQMRDDFVYCWKQSPALLAVAQPNMEGIRAEIRRVFELTANNGCPTEVLMRDVRTLAYRPENAAQWVRVAREEAMRLYG